jgi:hypothetical protein
MTKAGLAGLAADAGVCACAGAGAGVDCAQQLETPADNTTAMILAHFVMIVPLQIAARTLLYRIV